MDFTQCSCDLNTGQSQNRILAKTQVPHSQCSRRENCKFFHNFRPENIMFREKFSSIFWCNIWHYDSGWSFKSKNLLHYFTKLSVFHKRKFPKLRSKMQVSFVNEAPDLYLSSLWMSKNLVWRPTLEYQTSQVFNPTSKFNLNNFFE